ncbi:palindromic element RPE2 domain-containing protein [Rickettsia endosymbiont of Oedothorax gibbosus]|uniref:palindromic element RPE2 domain-containing protein n=1 Tax=Rickettsia endosymbiont of Oedothorax gibbosus TaxID=931099 RepID=UPI002024BA6C|nr:palindromic element RPE2 domain-containing protein [Rickettsia endosymbiont of Oedothorax gibbosus]
MATNKHDFLEIGIVNSGEFGTRNDGATPISNRRATSDDVTNFPSIDYTYFKKIMFIRSQKEPNIELF